MLGEGGSAGEISSPCVWVLGAGDAGCKGQGVWIAPPPHSLVEIELLILHEKILSSIPSARSECGNGNVLQAGDALWSLSLSLMTRHGQWRLK